MISAARRTSPASTPHTSATASGVHGSTTSRSSSRPRVCAATYASSTQPRCSSSRASPFISAWLVPLRTARCTSACRATSVARGSTHTTLGRSGPAIRSSTRAHSTVCVSGMLCP